MPSQLFVLFMSQLKIFLPQKLNIFRVMKGRSTTIVPLCDYLVSHGIDFQKSALTLNNKTTLLKESVAILMIWLKHFSLMLLYLMFFGRMLFLIAPMSLIECPPFFFRVSPLFKNYFLMLLTINFLLVLGS